MFTEAVILASASPRRLEILTSLGCPCVLKPVDADESVFDAVPVAERVERLAELKLRTCVEALGRNPALPAWIVAADTLVALDKSVFGKAQSYDEARRMIRCLANKQHTVYSGLAVLNRHTGQLAKDVSKTLVRFTDIRDDELDAYMATGEWQGVAGAYRIQGLFSVFIENIEGSYYGVMGLPVHAFYAMLQSVGYPFGN